MFILQLLLILFSGKFRTLDHCKNPL